MIAGRYRPQAPIGRGAMGVVWRARDQLLDRDVAIKEVQIADTLTDAERATAFQRTLREAKTAARLNHPAVVTVYDVAEDGGRPWIVMQLVHAQSLDQVLGDSGPLSPRRAAEMARQLLSALSVAHAAGVMHRDVKPSNVLIGSDDRAVLTDFGIATFADDPKLTQTGMVMGSPGFTAPERIRGEDASPASDLWSLGATIYAAVEGHGPFEQRGGAITTMSAIINEDAPEAPTAGALGPVIAALLRREPADRPDASEAARMITNVLPLLADRAPGSPAGYEATALSASSPPAPGPVSPGPVSPGSGSPGSASPGSASPGLPGAVRPRTPVPDENSLAYQPTVIKPPDPPAANTGPPRGAPASAAAASAAAAQTAPTKPQPSQPPQPSQGGWGQGAGSGYSPAGYAGPAGSAARPEGSQPDFSSWYNQSPRSGASSPPGFGYPPPAGYAPAAWSGQASQQPPAWSGAEYAPSRRRRSGFGWKAAVAALAIVGAAAGAGTVVLLHQGHSGSPQGQGQTTGTGTGSASGSASGSSSASLPPPTLQIVDAINKPASGSLPSGFTMTSQPAASNEKAGFTIAVPPSWQKSTSGHQTYLTDPADSNTNVLIDLTPHTDQNMLQEAQYIEAQSIPRFPGYHRVGMAATQVRGTTGAWWKFTWNKKGVQQEALDLLFVLHTPAGPQSYALYVTAPESKFDQMRPIFDEEAETFATLPS
ncbi:MAG TPA: protein kinase [Streptosporangiaceae bacterium]|nr:protein kinase [Streptosporangiaceae bacterium]